MEHRPYRACWQVRRKNGAQGWRTCMCRAGRRAEWSTGLSGLCSLWGRQECLPYLRQECLPYLRQECLPYLNADSECSVPSVPSECSVDSVPSEFSEEFCCSRNLPRGTIGPEGVWEVQGLLLWPLPGLMQRGLCHPRPAPGAKLLRPRWGFPGVVGSYRATVKTHAGGRRAR